MKLYRHTLSHKWTVDELISTIKLIKWTDFKVKDVNVDLHKRVAAALQGGILLVITCGKVTWTAIRI